MRASTKIILLGCSAVLLSGAFLLATGCLSTPRNFSSPPAQIRVVDQDGAPIAGLEAGRNWSDFDTDLDGNDQLATDQNGTARFPKVPADIGWFTGWWRKTFCQLAMDGLDSGTHTLLYIRYPGVYDVHPIGKALHPAGLYQQDPDGVCFIASLDRHSHTLVELRFPAKTLAISYELSSKRHGD